MGIKLKVSAYLAASLFLLAAAPAVAASPQPVKGVSATLYSGRWYEIARTPNMMENGCEGVFSDFRDWDSGAFSVVQICRRGSPVGPKQTNNASGHILPASSNAKMKLGYFGGLISREYWIVDHSDDGAWAIMATPEGRYVWLLSRRPVLDAATKAHALQRLASFGFDCARLAFPRQLPG